MQNINFCNKYSDLMQFATVKIFYIHENLIERVHQ